MKDNEIVKALERCIDNSKDCSECVFLGTEIKEFTTCHVKMIKNALELINRLEAENNVLHRDNDRLLEEIQDEKNYSRKIIEKYKSKLINAYKKLKRARTEAIKDFAKKLKEETIDIDVSFGYGREHYTEAVTTIAIDNLVKEMVGEGG